LQNEEFGTLKPDLRLLLDNATRWNSAFTAIQRGLRLREAINLLLAEENGPPQEDKLDNEDWDELRKIYDGLKPYNAITLRLEGYGKTGSHGVIWEALPALDYLLRKAEAYIRSQGFEPGEDSLAQPTRGGSRRSATQTVTRPNPLVICHHNAWEVLNKYNYKTDENYEIYAAATLLNPTLRGGFFIDSWTGDAEAYIAPMLARNENIWRTQYLPNPVTATAEEYRSDFDAFIDEISHTAAQSTPEDAFSRYMNDTRTPRLDWEKQGLFKWWQSCQYAPLRQWAYDVLSVPAMSAELERVFSQAKTATTGRYSLAAATLEAELCLKHWVDAGLYTVNSLASDEYLSGQSDDAI
jgi:hypothetical protein